jgi:hypothetical protein
MVLGLILCRSRISLSPPLRDYAEPTLDEFGYIASKLLNNGLGVPSVKSTILLGLPSANRTLIADSLQSLHLKDPINL